MTLGDWIAQASSLSTAHSGLEGLAESTVRRALIQLHRLFYVAPNALHIAYKRLDEEHLLKEAGRREERIINGGYGWALPANRKPEDWALVAGSQIRALDSVLMTVARSHLGPPSDPSEWLCAEERVFAIPRKHPRQPSSTERNGQSYSRRGLLYHRLIPAETHGYKVELVQQRTIPLAADKPLDLAASGAALFSGLELKFKKKGKDFIVTDVLCCDAIGTVKAQIRAAIAEGCFSVVWPELTMPVKLRDAVGSTLRERALGTDPRPAPQVLVAGTWHEAVGSKVRNVATVFDGYGNITLRYEKAIPYEDKEVGVEGITLGDKISVLVTDDQLITFGICKDFCDLSLDLPYPELDVDLVLVPSMGGDTTMAGHQVTAKEIRVRYGARTFVVQQVDPGHASGRELGYVLPMLDDPIAPKPGDLQQSVTWKSYPWTSDQKGTK